MKTIIAGSRGITDIQHIRDAVAGFDGEISEVVSGTARGVDRLGEQWAQEQSVPVARFPADWNQHGKKAGYLRNREMAAYADALIAVWDGVSRGTKNMIEEMEELEKVVHVHRVGGE